MYRCSKCGQPWDDTRAQDNELTCTRRCGGQLVPVAPPALPDLEGCDFVRLPYPVALTAQRLAAALRASGDVLKTLFLLKDCFEATIKYLGAVMLADYRLGSACTPEHNASLLEKMIRPSLGVWVDTVVGSLSRWLVGDSRPGGLVASLFMTPGKKPRETELFAQCRAFVEYRNSALGHGAMRSDRVYDADLRTWMPRLRELLDGVARLAEWRLCLPTDRDRCRLWMGPQPGDATEPGDFTQEQVGRFVLRGPDGPVRDLYPFLCYLPDPQQERRLHFYDSVCRYSTARKEVEALEYDHGFKQASAEPVAGLEEAFTADLLAKAFGRHRERMAVIEGRVANFGELIEAHAAIVGRQFVIDHVRSFLAEHDGGLLVIEAQPGKGKTALMAHLIEEVFGHYAPRPVHFFYRRTAGITDPDVCVRSLYHALLEAHGITEAEESKQKNSPEEVFIKLTNLLSQEIAPRLLPGRPQLIFTDALDEAAGNAFQRIPENLPAGVYIIATTRPVSDRAALARRQHLYWYDLDSPDLLQENLRDGFEYVQRELAGTELPNETLEEVVRIGVGNFLVLKLLCQHLRTTLPPDQVAAFLRRLATDGGKDQLGFIYAEFWQRLTERCTREDVNLLCDVAGVLVTAHAPLTADMVCEVLGLRAGDWDFAFRHLAEYLTVVENDEEGVRATFYRIYHESFADFLRAKVEVDRNRFCTRLADFCLSWSQLPEGYARTYALRFGPQHLLEAGRQEEAVALLLDLLFLEAKVAAELEFDLARDFTECVQDMPEDRLSRRILQLLGEAFLHDIQFIIRHPTTLFQCMWNRCWWYDCPAAAQHYEPPADGAIYEPPSPKLQRPLSTLMERWRGLKTEAEPGFRWLRSLRPPPIALGGGLRVFSGHHGSVESVAVSPDGQLIASGSADKTIGIWEADSGILLDFFRGHENTVAHVGFSHDGRRIVSASKDNTVRVWDVDSGVELRCLPQGGVVHSVACSRDGRLIVSGYLIVSGSVDNKTVRVWDAATGTELRCARHDGSVQRMAISPDGRRVVSGRDDGTVRIWDIATGTELHCLHEEDEDYHDSFRWLAFSVDGGRVVSVTEPRDYGPVVRLQVWDADSGRELHRLYPDNLSLCAEEFAFSPDGRRVVSGGYFGTVRIWDIERRREFRQLDTFSDQIHSLAFSPDGQRIVIGSYDNRVYVWDVNSGAQPRYLFGPEHWVQDVAFSPDGHRLVSAGERAVWVWDAHTGAVLRVFPEVRALDSDKTRRSRSWGDITVKTVAFSPDGQRILGALTDDTVRMWNADGGAELRCLSHEHGVYSVAFSPDGRRIISRSDDDTVRVWDAETLNCIEVFQQTRDISIAIGEPSVAWRAVPEYRLETAIESATTGEPVAWWPTGLCPIAAHPSGRIWAGASGNYLCLFTLEGDG